VQASCVGDMSTAHEPKVRKRSSRRRLKTGDLSSPAEWMTRSMRRRVAALYEVDRRSPVLRTEEAGSGDAPTRRGRLCAAAEALGGVLRRRAPGGRESDAGTRVP
jgi:hypothetical protein